MQGNLLGWGAEGCFDSAELRYHTACRMQNMGRRAEYPPFSLPAYEAAARFYKAAALRFVLTELDIATTLCELARTMRDKSRVLATMRNANIAVRAALRAKSHLRLTRDETCVIADRMNKIKTLFDDLRERRKLGSDSSGELQRRLGVHC